MITREADYAIRTVLYLSKEENRNQFVSTSKLAEEMFIPYRVSRKVIGWLAKAGFVESLRGKNGGVKLALPREGITLLDVLAAVDERSVTLNSCLLPNSDCPLMADCPVRKHLLELQKDIDAQLSQITFEQLA